jgi:hypothetical protein
MRPRPVSRRRQITVVAAGVLAERIEPLTRVHKPPAAIVSGPREWLAVKRQPEARAWYRIWPGMEETFCDVPVIIRPGFGAPKVFDTQAELEDVLLGGD